MTTDQASKELEETLGYPCEVKGTERFVKVEVTGLDPDLGCWAGVQYAADAVKALAGCGELHLELSANAETVTVYAFIEQADRVELVVKAFKGYTPE